jgi:hypothetical protein
VEYADYKIKLNSKPTKWDTATGVLQTNGTVQIEGFILPQFAQKRYITSSLHMYQKRPQDKYDFILGHDLLQEIGFDIYYSASQFVWDNIIVDMVPCGYWTQKKIETMTKMWRKRSETETAQIVIHELQVTEIKPAEYKPVEIKEVVEKQTHLTPFERIQLQTMLIDFQDLFKGQRGQYNGEPIELELLPGSKPFYAKPFSIPKAYQQVTRDEIARLE